MNLCLSRVDIWCISPDCVIFKLGCVPSPCLLSVCSFCFYFGRWIVRHLQCLITCLLAMSTHNILGCGSFPPLTIPWGYLAHLFGASLEFLVLYLVRLLCLVLFFAGALDWRVILWYPLLLLGSPWHSCLISDALDCSILGFFGATLLLWKIHLLSTGFSWVRLLGSSIAFFGVFDWHVIGTPWCAYLYDELLGLLKALTEHGIICFLPLVVLIIVLPTV